MLNFNLIVALAIFAPLHHATTVVPSGANTPCLPCTAAVPCPPGPVNGFPSADVLTCVRGICYPFTRATNIVNYAACAFAPSSTTTAPSSTTTAPSITTSTGVTSSAPLPPGTICSSCSAAQPCNFPLWCAAGKCVPLVNNRADNTACQSITSPCEFYRISPHDVLLATCRLSIAGYGLCLFALQGGTCVRIDEKYGAAVSYISRGITKSGSLYAHGLQMLYLNNNQLTSVDLNSLPSDLALIDLSSNQLKAVGLKPLASRLIEEVYLSNNQLTSVDFTSLPSGLRYIYVDNNQLTFVDVTSFPSSLVLIDLAGNPLMGTCVGTTYFPCPYSVALYGGLSYNPPAYCAGLSGDEIIDKNSAGCSRRLRAV